MKSLFLLPSLTFLIPTFTFISPTLAVPLQENSRSLTIQRRDNTTTTGISQALLDDFKLFANYTGASYCPANEDSATTAGTLITCPGSNCTLVEQDGAQSIIEFGGEGDTTLDDIKGFVSLVPSRELIVVAFAGSGSTIRNWLADFTFLLVAYTSNSTTSPCDSCYVHTGFITGWSERRSAVISAINSTLSNPSYANYTITITGHSIGAAIATLAAAELRSLASEDGTELSGYDKTIDTYTFGSPRVGNEAFADWVTAQSPDLGNNYRMTHVNDPIPQLPPELLGYEHTSPEYWLSDGNDTTVDYGTQDVVVCEGVGNDDCNAGTGLIPIDGTAHNYYLGYIAGCAGGLSF